MILVLGEALVDAHLEDGIVHAHPGGGPFNTAIALARLGVPTTFVSALARDAFGGSLRDALDAAGVVTAGPEATAPTPLALVERVGGEPAYRFYLRGTAFEEIDADPAVLDGAEAVFAGSLSLSVDPPAGAVEALALEASRRSLLVVDPNVRPAVVPDPAAYRDRFQRLAARAGVVKLSRQDAAWLYPGVPPADVAGDLLAAGAGCVVVTDGAAGASAWTRRVTGAVEAPEVDVVDTVGAGDAFTAGLLAWLRRSGRLDAEALEELSSTELRAALLYAVAAGAAQCTRAFAWGPTHADVVQVADAVAAEATSASGGG